MNTVAGEIFLVVELDGRGGINDYLDNCVDEHSAILRAAILARAEDIFENVSVIKATQFDIVNEFRCTGADT